MPDVGPSPALHPSDEHLLCAALQGNPNAWTHLVSRFDPYLSRAISCRAAAVSEDLHEEVKQELWWHIAQRPAEDFDPETSSAKHYIAGFLGRALDLVRAAYRDPGVRSRWRDGKGPRMHGQGRIDDRQLVTVSIEKLMGMEEPVDPSHQVQVALLEARVDLELLEAKAEPVIALAMREFVLHDLTLSAAADAAGVNRLYLRRRLVRLGLERRAA